MIANTERRCEIDRRTYSMTTLAKCALSPRRMHGRRSGDRRHAVLDRFDSGIFFLAIALMVLSVLDSIFTLIIISRGGSEANPFMDSLLQHSVWAFVGFKMLLTGVPAIVLAATGNLKLFGRYRAKSVLAALVGVYLGLMGYHALLLYQSSIY